MLKKLSFTDRQRVSDALTKCASETKNIEDPVKLADTAYMVFSKELGDNPGLFKAACQVYNSCKSIHKLSAADDNTRGDSFAILNVPEMSARLASDSKLAMRKHASIPCIFTSAKPIESAKLEKAASAVAEAVKKPVKAPEFTKGSYRQFLLSDLAATEDCLLKAANAVTYSEAAEKEAEDRFIASLAVIPPTMRKDACARLYSNYGEEFSALVEMFNSERPMYKVASADYKNKYKGTASLPDKDIAEAVRSLLQLRKAASEAREVFDFTISNAIDTIKDHVKFYGNLMKKADGSGDTFSKAIVKTKAIGDIADLIGDSKVDAASVERKVYNTQLVNAIVGHAAQRALIKAVQNPSISAYPMPEIIDAANRALANMPVQLRSMPATANQALFEGMLMKELATRSTPSKADVQSVAELTKAFSGLRPTYEEA